MTNYEHTTRLKFRTKVYERLGETGVFWPENEINSSIEEALLTFGAISGFWKEEIFFNTSENKRLYDLFIDSIIGGGFIAPTYTYQTIINWINRDLIENISDTTPNSEFLRRDELLKSIEAKYNLYQQLTNLLITQIDIEVAPNTNVISLPDYLIDVVRILFVDDNGNENLLLQSDEAELSYFDENILEAQQTPFYYTALLGKTKKINIYPAPSIHGILKVLFISGRDSTVALTKNTAIFLPNNLVPYLKYGVEADIFSKEGVGQDLARAAYCKQRWNEGIYIGLNYTSALLARANGKPILMDSLSSVDLYFDALKVRTPPSVLGFAGYNLFETDITPSNVNSSLQLSVIANAKIPATDAEFIEVDLEYIDTLADYVVHLSQIKLGAAELAQTEQLKNNFIKVALDHNERLQMRGMTYENLVGITKKEEKSNPRLVKANG